MEQLQNWPKVRGWGYVFPSLYTLVKGEKVPEPPASPGQSQNIIPFPALLSLLGLGLRWNLPFLASSPKEHEDALWEAKWWPCCKQGPILPSWAIGKQVQPALVPTPEPPSLPRKHENTRPCKTQCINHSPQKDPLCYFHSPYFYCSQHRAGRWEEVCYQPVPLRQP